MAIKIRQGTRDDPKKKGYYTIEGENREDVEKIRRSELMKQVRVQGAESVQRQNEAARHGEDVRYPGGRRMRLPIGMAEGAINYMKRNVPKGPPAVRTSFQMGAHIENGRVIRDGEE